MSFIAARSRLVDAVFRRLGEDAAWAGVDLPVRIILREQSDDVQLGDTRLMGTARFIRVRRSEVLSPAEGAIVEPMESGGKYRVIGEPMLDRRAVWLCEVTRLAV